MIDAIDKAFTTLFFAIAWMLVAGMACAQTVSRSEANNGQLIMEDVPAIPQEVVDSLNR